jgi:DNA-binding transcriptional MerR regulator
MKIGALSQASRCKIETIRYYEKIGLFSAPNRSAGNYRLYTDNHLKELKFILKARFLGFSIEQIRELQKLSTTETLASCDNVSHIASENLKLINIKINDLKNLKKQIKILLDDCRNNVESICPLIDNLYE